MIKLNFEDFLQWNNINLKYENLAGYVKGFAYYNGYEYLVIINSRCSYIQQQETLVHEMIHIFENHFSCSKGYEEKCEKEVNYFIRELQTNYIW